MQPLLSIMVTGRIQERASFLKEWRPVRHRDSHPCGVPLIQGGGGLCFRVETEGTTIEQPATAALPMYPSILRSGI